MALLGTKSVQAAFAIMAEATRRAGEYGSYNAFIRGLPSIPDLDPSLDLKEMGNDLPQSVKFIIYQFLSKPGKCPKLRHNKDRYRRQLCCL